MSLIRNPHHMTTASITLNPASIIGADATHSGRLEYDCGCYLLAGRGWHLCQYHDGYNDAWEEAVPEPDDVDDDNLETRPEPAPTPPPLVPLLDTLFEAIERGRAHRKETR